MSLKIEVEPYGRDDADEPFLDLVIDFYGMHLRIPVSDLETVEQVLSKLAEGKKVFEPARSIGEL